MSPSGGAASDAVAHGVHEETDDGAHLLVGVADADDVVGDGAANVVVVWELDAEPCEVVGDGLVGGRFTREADVDLDRTLGGEALEQTAAGTGHLLGEMDDDGAEGRRDRGAVVEHVSGSDEEVVLVVPLAGEVLPCRPADPDDVGCSVTLGCEGIERLVGDVGQLPVGAGQRFLGGGVLGDRLEDAGSSASARRMAAAVTGGETGLRPAAARRAAPRSSPSR